MYACMFLCMYPCMYCMSIYVCIYICMSVCFSVCMSIYVFDWLKLVQVISNVLTNFPVRQNNFSLSRKFYWPHSTLWPFIALHKFDFRPKLRLLLWFVGLTLQCGCTISPCSLCSVLGGNPTQLYIQIMKPRASQINIKQQYQWFEIITRHSIHYTFNIIITRHSIHCTFNTIV